jgi:hypothetical protein
MNSIVIEMNRLESRLLEESTVSHALGVEMSKFSGLASEAIVEATRLESEVAKLQGKVGQVESIGWERSRRMHPTPK